MYSELTTPAVIVDLNKVEINIKKMADNLKENGVVHRPHIKSHKTTRLAKLQLQGGAVGITVAKISEAEVFAAAGFDDIFIAYSIVGQDKLNRFAELHKDIRLLTTVDSEVVAKGLSMIGERTGKKVDVLIELDGGLHRGGRQPGMDIVDFSKRVNKLPGINIVGVMSYFGQIYDENKKNLSSFVERESSVLKNVIRDFSKEGISTQIISSGSTPSSFLTKYFKGNVTEVRAGNYIFYDVSAVDLGIAKEEDCALFVVATVISTPLPGTATIDAGSKTLTSDKSHHRDGYGIVVGRPGVSVVGLNEEHGYLKYDTNNENLVVGDRILIIPNHSCVLTNLCDEIAGVRDGKVVEYIEINARGKNK